MTQSIDVDRIDLSITMINTYIKDESVAPILALLEKLKNTPEDISNIDKLSNALDKLGVFKGAVLTYAPYITVLISDDPFDNKEIW